ncbi:GntR family transcriptional regulator [Sphaerimonospora thailandensis]|uniref:Putative HTH-type transcriptional regulator n=1 Tax=Sphaerimonospora thailandensis TaxID=795644 RepID=A0A8J3REI6_9ACTN|nr:GntR family transcriptional regulator [Sphaerimonospora thailandensis]GIH73538.1 putative HTH-type transcriptional regulator [Sphaerimonospora thailandensis]
MHADPHSPARRIVADLRDDITAGRLPAGAKLPSVRDLADRYSVSRSTASKALILLKTEGLVSTRHGSGAYVREPYPVRRLGPDRYARSRWQVTVVEAYENEHADAAATRQQGHQTQEISLVEADEHVAAALGLQPGTIVYERARVMTRDSVPTHTMTSYYRVEDVEGTPLVDPSPGIAGPGGGFQVLADRGLPPQEITEDLNARVPTADETLLLELPPGEAVVEVRRTTRTAEGRAIEYARGVHAASRFMWSYTFAVPD